MPKIHLMVPDARSPRPWTRREVALLTVLVDELNVVRVALNLPELTCAEVQAMVQHEEERGTA